MACALTYLFTLAVRAQQTGPVIVQPGAPGQPSKVLPASTRAQLPPRSKKDVEFMQGMIHHHAQAVEMVELIAARTTNKDVRLIGARISQSQLDEMKFMKRWLEAHGEPAAMAMSGEERHSDSHSAHGENHPAANAAPLLRKEESLGMLMPGMLTKEQVSALRNAKGAEFDRLFLTGMIQHHNGALVMVKDLYDTAGAGQDAELFTFASDVDSGQRAEIRSMQNILTKIP